MYNSKYMSNTSKTESSYGKSKKDLLLLASVT